MTIEKVISPVKNFFAKVGKRNLIVAGAVILIGVAVWLNWLLFFNTDSDGYDGYDQSAGMNPSGNTSVDNNSSADYFSASQISRQKARDEALEVLQNVVDNEDADEVSKSQAIADMAAIAAEIEQEANIETLIKAKGFTQCVAILNGESATVVVNCASTLTQTELAQINTVVYEQAGIIPSNITIISK